MSGSIKSKENFWLLSFWRLMSRVNNVQENNISGEKKPRRIKSQGNSCPGGKFWRKTYREEKVWGKDGAKPCNGPTYLDLVDKSPTHMGNMGARMIFL